MKWRMGPIIGISLLIGIASASCDRPIPTVSPISPLVPTSAPNPIIEVPGNLLADPSVEGPYHSQDGHPEINVSTIWRAYYRDIPPCIPFSGNCYVPCPSNCLKPGETPKCQSDYGCYWARPELNPIDYQKASYRVHSGNLAQMGFTYGRMGEWGLYQTISITPGTWLQFSAWMHAWQCFEYGPACEWGHKSDKPYNMHLRIGIDPDGGSDPYSPGIVWSGEQHAYDVWTQFSIITQAKAGSLTVFTHVRAEFDYARMNNDVYIDDLALVAIQPLNNRTYLPAVAR